MHFIRWFIPNTYKKREMTDETSIAKEEEEEQTKEIKKVVWQMQ